MVEGGKNYYHQHLDTLHEVQSLLPDMAI